MQNDDKREEKEARNEVTQKSGGFNSPLGGFTMLKRDQGLFSCGILRSSDHELREQKIESYFPRTKKLDLKRLVIEQGLVSVEGSYDDNDDVDAAAAEVDAVNDDDVIGAVADEVNVVDGNGAKRGRGAEGGRRERNPFLPPAAHDGVAALLAFAAEVVAIAVASVPVVLDVDDDDNFDDFDDEPDEGFFEDYNDEDDDDDDDDVDDEPDEGFFEDYDSSEPEDDFL